MTVLHIRNGGRRTHHARAFLTTALAIRNLLADPVKHGEVVVQDSLPVSFLLEALTAQIVSNNPRKTSPFG